ncbi:type IV pilus secretin PilQ [Verminephrobacter aporrectodeae subsp. tuberculatae]|uniref:type IV pilus secretin PilQ n=1 Tax=Verminephrobacter aporrectodeae TaxID=1110389 RepID=UPI002237ADE8|nr:type IV pilus secretin PilQ [Verminephrobacter aporrectodeae]MCW5222842.1 type IV pilus secretin PilQ [Verminephrobacter aporrectodeae subsp. tuberculatae]MCW5288306.1 type IV pilus secretin PilQ [Verminephrobacter aporrectodeae subsp. tuberculatae]MCW8197222.1 type IV pilus secretin PilQ [Verminephrobacter aporrectodeae subsp. tuberculatae]
MKHNNGLFMNFFRNAAMGVFIAILSFAAAAQVEINALASSVQSGVEILKIDFSDALAKPPTGFATQSPARIALDFQGVSNSTGKSVHEMNLGNLKSVNIVQTSGRTRVILNLKSPSSYHTDIQGKSLVLSLGSAAAASSAAATPAANVSENESGEISSLKDIDFRRGTDGSGRVIVNLASTQVGVDLQQQPKGIMIEFLHSSLPEGLRRRLDVSDFGTPVQTVTTTQSGERVRMLIESTGDWEHSAYQSDNQFVVEIRQKKVDLSKLTQGPGYSGEKLSLNFQNIEVRSLLQVIADFTNFNIVTSDTVGGTLTLRLKDVPWDQALQIIMDARGLGMRKSGSVIWIAPKDEIDARIKKEFEAAQAIQRLEPLRTQAFQLNYAKAADLITQLSAGGGGGGAQASRFLSERGSAISEPRTNQLFVTDTPGKLEEVRLLLANLDIPVRQVLIEARIVEARDSFGRSLGVRLGATDLRANRGGDGGYGIGGNNRVAFGTSYNNAIASSGAGGNTSTNGNFVNLPASISTESSVGSFALSIFNAAANRFLNLELSAMEADGKGRIVSSPRIITADQTKALIEQGTEYPYSVTAPNGATTLAFKKAVLKLEVTPQITPEGSIILDLDVNKDSRGESTDQGVAIDTKHIKTQILIENGGTVVIGGIFEMEETNQESRIPFIGDIPVVGNLFKKRTKESTKREMLVFITPKVISDNGPKR